MDNKNTENKKLIMYVICSHVDKPLDGDEINSAYNVPIQAGAALTDKRIYPLNDHDNFPDSISDRNQRYSEMTAMYYISKHIESEYLGIQHYRRRFLLTDSELSNYMDKGFDIITTKSYPLPEKISDNYRVSYYAADWDLFMDLIKEFIPGDLSLAHDVFDRDYIHPCNMNIFSANVYSEYCDYVFPILDSFYHQSPWKKDIYQRRDVGFIGERLSSLFVEKKKLSGARVYEAPFRDLRSKGWSPKDECNLHDYNAVYEACKKYYSANDITKCRLLVAEALTNGGISDKRIRSLGYLFRAGIREQRKYKTTMYEYLPEKWSSDLDTLLAAFESVGTLVKILSSGITEDGIAMYNEFMSSTGFSAEVFHLHCEMNGVDHSLYNIITQINQSR